MPHDGAMNLNWWAVGGVALLGAYAWRAVTSLNVEEVTLGPYVVLYIRAKVMHGNIFGLQAQPACMHSSRPPC